MSSINIPKNYSAQTTPTERQLDDIKDSVEEFFNITGIAADNVSTSSLTSNVILAASVSQGKLQAGSIPGNKKTINYATNTCGVAADSVQATITTTGRPVLILVDAANASGSYITGSGNLVIRRNGSGNKYARGRVPVRTYEDTGSPAINHPYVPATAWTMQVDLEVVGLPATYVYDLTDVGAFTMNNIRLTVIEI